jgi:hypothetical protein
MSLTQINIENCHLLGYSAVYMDRRFGGTYHLRHQGRKSDKQETCVRAGSHMPSSWFRILLRTYSKRMSFRPS